MKKIALIWITLFCLLFTYGCNESIGNNGMVEIITSKNFGAEILSNKSLEIADRTTVLDVMEEDYEIETAYGGDFVNGIDGLESGFTNQKDRKKVDWFYYINGILAQVGSGDYELTEGDLVIWDYHYWDQPAYLNSIIGAYPMNFINGYSGNILSTSIFYTDGYDAQGNKLKAFLRDEGVSNISVSTVNEELLQNNEGNTIVIGLWDELLKTELIQDLYKNKKKIGLFFEINESIEALDYKGNVVRRYDKGAVITSVLKDYSVMSTTWIVTGNDEHSIKDAVRMLYESPESIKGMFSVMIAEDELIALPSQQ